MFFLAFIRLTQLGFCLINCVNTCYSLFFVFIYISGVSSICSEKKKNCIAFLVNLLIKSVFVNFKNLRFYSF